MYTRRPGRVILRYPPPGWVCGCAGVVMVQGGWHGATVLGGAGGVTPGIAASLPDHESRTVAGVRQISCLWHPQIVEG